MRKTTFALLAFAVSLTAGAQQRVALREGVIVHPAQSTAYVMLPQGGVGAVDLASGTMRWTSTAADKPLALAGNLLVSQVAPRSMEARNRLELVALDVQQRGGVAVRNSTDLPAGVQAATGQTLEGRFIATGRADAGGAVVTWLWQPQPIRGVPPPRRDRPFGNQRGAGPFRAAESLEEVRGMVRMHLSTGRMTRSAVEPEGLIPAASSTWIVQSPERIGAAPAAGRQFESADGKHILQSERVSDDREFEKYRWTVFDRASGARLGETRSHISFAPFVVRGGMLVFETTPFGRTPRESEPAKLRGVHLASGEERWSVAIGEVVYRGPMPP
ncbi:MAG TPA: hypothetical protein VEU30_11855 [Thermoanaerobaculia bacterium]|nr:hypothetical protein [Thermoanaerobaculia bacterium]